jgi:hypothetical protein
MRTSLVRQALDAYTSGNYALALSIYQNLAQQLGQEFFSANIALCRKQIQKIRPGRDSAQVPLGHLKVACIMDDFTLASYAPECQLYPLSPQNGLEELQEFQPDLLFVESAWRGKNGLWNRKVSHPGSELKTVLDWCRTNAVPTAFWNKEDPVHYNTFLSTAQLFDHVFTTDIDCIAQYKAALRHERVYLLPFACQPTLQNPLERYPRKDAFCFAGAYYVRYPERTRDLEEYVATLPAHRPLEIFDRYFGEKDVNYQFPEKFHDFIIGALPYDEIDRAYKGYRYAINLNSIKNSQTMFARRVYELLASNTVTVSNYSRGMRLLLGDLVLASDNGGEILRKLETMDAETIQKFRLAGLRKVMSEHTYGHRFQYLAQKLLGCKKGSSLPVMACAALAATPDDAQWILKCYQGQSHRQKSLLLVLGEGLERIVPESLPSGVTTVSLAEAHSLSPASYTTPETWLAVLSSQDYYGRNYLLDLALATTYSGAQIIGKGAYYRWTEEGPSAVRMGSAYSEQNCMPYRCCAVSSSALPDDVTVGCLLEDDSLVERSGQCLAVDPFNYCHKGREADLKTMRPIVNDLPIDSGMVLDDLLSLAESIPPAVHNASSVPHWNADRFMQLFKGMAVEDSQEI